MRSYQIRAGPSPMIGILIRGEFGQTHRHRRRPRDDGDRHSKDRRKPRAVRGEALDTCSPRASGREPLLQHLDSGLLGCETIKFCCLKPPGLWYLVTGN